ncbi:glucokinase [Actinomortierella ambigua]|nr:glucokinase [Actinomortierella ambigua]
MATPIAAKHVEKLARHRIDPNDITYTCDTQKEVVLDIVRQFTLSTEKLHEIKANFQEGMRKGLAKDGETLAMITSFGSFLALDVGGTNLRVVNVLLGGSGQISTRQAKYKIDEALKVGPAKALFDFIASCVDNFLDEHQIRVHGGSAIQMGFTFSFPVLQTSINRGTLITWTKGFNASGMVGKDPVIMLQDAFNRRHVPVQVAALVNDTVGTLLAYAYNNPETAIGVIFGTGTNGAYIEQVDRIPKWRGPSQEREMIINMEFGAFDKERAVLPLTMFDNKLDRKSVNPNKQLFEKLIAGMYLGEITRNVLLHLIDRRLVFNGNISSDLNQMWTFETAYMSAIEADSTPTLHHTKKILEATLNFPPTSLNDRQIVKLVVELVGRRAARLGGVALAAILDHTGDYTQKTAIGIDGSLYEFYPSFDTDLLDCIEEMLGAEARQNVSIGLAQDGSGVGAALCALLASRNGDH